ncbi:hypothetical protein ACJJH9_04090 [Microbulbifer sp. DLAB2-AF]|uniref:hypothetical protein n=1 Tax=unclassified Microbulbifer TaxID=2619833 RepID=UPI004039DC1F
MPRKINSLRLPGKGSKYYLEFLRNLAPKILLFAFVLIIGGKLDFTKIDLSNWEMTLIFYVLLIAFLLAFIGNFRQLYTGCYSDIDRWSKKIFFKANISERTGLSKLWFFALAILKTRLIVFLELLFVSILLPIVLALIVRTSFSSANNLLL